MNKGVNKLISVINNEGEEMFIKYTKENVELLELEVNGMLPFVQEFETTDKEIISSSEILSFEVVTK